MPRDYKVEKDWTTEAGLRAVVIEITPPELTRNWRCGYVEVPKGHPLHGVAYNKPCPDSLAEYEQSIMDKPVGGRGPIEVLATALKPDDVPVTAGFLLDVHGSVTYSGESTDYPIETDGTFWYGFDCNHVDDQEDPKSLDFCVAQCESMAEQLISMKETSNA